MEDARVRAYLAARMQALGLEVRAQAAPLGERGRGRLARWGLAGVREGVNLIGVLPGRDRSAPAVLVMAHHDTVAGSPGAPDDSAGVAAALEIARALRASGPPARDVVLLFTDAEELDSSGALAFFRHDPLARRVDVVINLEARGGGGRAVMFETGEGNGAAMRLFARAVGRPSAQSIAVLIYRLLPNASDFTVPKRAGLAGFNFAFLGEPALYHAPQATPDRLDLGSLQHLGAQALDLARALSNAPQTPPRTADAVFGDVLGLALAIYPAQVGWLLLGLAAAGLAAAGAVAIRAEAATVRGGAAGLGLGLAYLAVTGGLLHLFNLVSGAGPDAGYYDRLAAVPRLELQAALVSLAPALLLLAPRRGRRRGDWGPWLGLGALILAAGAAVQVIAPTAAPMLVWPLVLAAAAGALAAAFGPGLEKPVALAALATALAIGAAQTLALAHLAFLGVGADLPAVVAAPAVVVLMLVWPLAADMPSRRVAVTASLALLALAGGLALSVRLDAPAQTVPIYARR
jgi:hypothetical protein